MSGNLRTYGEFFELKIILEKNIILITKINRNKMFKAFFYNYFSILGGRAFLNIIKFYFIRY